MQNQTLTDLLTYAVNQLEYEQSEAAANARQAIRTALAQHTPAPAPLPAPLPALTTTEETTAAARNLVAALARYDANPCVATRLTVMSSRSLLQCELLEANGHDFEAVPTDTDVLDAMARQMWQETTQQQATAEWRKANGFYFCALKRAGFGTSQRHELLSAYLGREVKSNHDATAAELLNCADAIGAGFGCVEVSR